MTSRITKALEVDHRVRVSGMHPHALTDCHIAQGLLGAQDGQWTIEPAKV